MRPWDIEHFIQREVRVVLIGQRWAGKSLSGNTILGADRFECGRTRTTESEGRHEEVEGRRLVVVDAPGWNSSLSLNETPQGGKQRFKLNVYKCPPGPHVFLLVIPIDSAFCAEQRRILEEHIKLLGERAWKYAMVLFTCGDFLGKKTIEQHIESEGDALRWLIEKCRNRYHVFDNKTRSDPSQVTQLLKKVDEMVWYNNGSYYEVDEQTLNIIEKRQQEVAERAEIRRRRAEERREQMEKLVPEEMKTIPKLQMILLGSKGVGKTSVGNAILGIKAQEDGKRTAHSAARQGFVGKTEITLVDTPGWWKGFRMCDTPVAIREELMRSMFLCPPGPHVFLLMIDADASFTSKHLEAVKTHMELFGESVWRHTIIVFTRGDWLGAHSVEEYIEGEGEALQALVEECGNRYHVIDNKNPDDGTQVNGLLEKITWMVAANNWGCFVPNEKIRSSIEEKKQRVEEGARQRQSWVQARRNLLTGSNNKLPDLRILMLGQKTVGKTATGTNLLQKEVFPTSQNKECQVEKAEVADRLITVIDTPGWWVKPSIGTEEIDKEITRSVSLSPSGVHAVLLVVPLDVTFREPQQAALEEHMSLFDPSVWKHAIVLFTYGDNLADKSVEEHIEREHSALRWLVDKCENRYHVMNNTKKNDTAQVIELFEKTEEMVAGNSGQLFCPDENDIQERLVERHQRRLLKWMLEQALEKDYRRRDIERLEEFKKTLLELQSEIRGIASSSSQRSSLLDLNQIKIKGIGQSKRDEKEKILDAKISQKIEDLNKEILRSKDVLGRSMDFLIPDLKGGRSMEYLTPDLNGESPESPFPESSSDRRSSDSQMDKVLSWLSKLQISTNVDNQLSLNFSQSSGYRSVLPTDFSDFPKEADIRE
ncbi:GTPase IMAP family member 8-like [Halichoeres trimaculatus]|uniref:GTPase IMAP family member 8-like n=1 Tax=Halichoeres trimaculatus TaxID=147232 RepID=UPI003D9F5F6C